MYFVRAAREMGHQAVVLDPDPRCPANQHADEHIIAAFDDVDALVRMGAMCDAVTVEFENVPRASLERLAEHTNVRPSPQAVAIAQDRRLEKDFLRRAGLPVGAFAVLESAADAQRIADAGVLDGAPFGAAVVKTATLGYDGKGQVRISGPADLPDAFASLGNRPCVVEELLPLDLEVSVVLARGADGPVACFEPTVNVHRNGILHTSVVPGLMSSTRDAQSLAVRVAEQLEYVGVLGVEFFVSAGRLLVNEIAPRPHNSGHWTIDGAVTSQFHQQVRAVLGLPLGDPSLNCGGAAMVNLLGDLWESGEPKWTTVQGRHGARLHLYGKSEPRSGRKMGHITALAESPRAALEAVEEMHASLTDSGGQ